MVAEFLSLLAGGGGGRSPPAATTISSTVTLVVLVVGACPFTGIVSSFPGPIILRLRGLMFFGFKQLEMRFRDGVQKFDVRVIFWRLGSNFVWCHYLLGRLLSNNTEGNVY